MYAIDCCMLGCTDTRNQSLSLLGPLHGASFQQHLQLSDPQIGN
jgi:hypothetical protein